jgi:hypothetical protein
LRIVVSNFPEYARSNCSARHSYTPLLIVEASF